MFKPVFYSAQLCIICVDIWTRSLKPTPLGGRVLFDFCLLAVLKNDNFNLRWISWYILFARTLQIYNIIILVIIQNITLENMQFKMSRVLIYLKNVK